MNARKIHKQIIENGNKKQQEVLNKEVASEKSGQMFLKRKQKENVSKVIHLRNLGQRVSSFHDCFCSADDAALPTLRMN